MTELTPAQRQARLLISLADHLATHPHLSPVYLTAHGVVHVPQRRAPDAGPRSAEALAAWLRSVGVTTLRAHPDSGHAAVHAYAVTIGGHPVPDLWGAVPGLQRWLTSRPQVPGDWRGGVPVTVDELEYYAQHGTLLERDEPR